MTITFKNGNLFNEDADAIVNTVNCVGVMGKGVALEFKKRWPKNYVAYREQCEANALEPGKLYIHDNRDLLDSTGPNYLINFPTKKHWRSKSKIEYIEKGLETLCHTLPQYNIKRVAMPPLGCGNGGLSWPLVKQLIEEKLSGVPDIEFVIMEDRSKPNDPPEHESAPIEMTYERAITLKALGDLEHHFDGRFDRLSIQKLVYFLQALGVNYPLVFSRNKYGPYSDTVKRAFKAFESLGLVTGFTSKLKLCKVTSGGYAAADEFLTSIGKDSANKTIGQLDKLIEGYESPYGLELLSSVHWLWTFENVQDEGQLVKAITSWNDSKKEKFSPKAIKASVNRLAEDSLIAS